MRIHNTTVVDRENRPNISQRVGLRTFFINDGAYVDPYEISSVQLFRESDTLSPNSVVDATSLLVDVVPLMTFAASATNIAQGNTVHCTKPLGGEGICVSAFAPYNYTPGTTASGIYRIGVGDYVVVLDQINAASGWDWNTKTQVATSGLSAVNDYVDLWTVKLNEGSRYQILTNRFSLYEDTFFTFTEPLLLTTRNNLLNKHVRLGEIIDLKVTTETTLQNKNIPQSMQNIFKESLVTSAIINVAKVNYEPNLPGPFKVVTNKTMRVTSDNTLLYNWNTTGLTGSVTAGSPLGTYSVQVTYHIINQKFKSPLFYLTVS